MNQPLSSPPPSPPPIAPRQPFEHTEHGVTRSDPYHWMHGDPSALTAYLASERTFYDSSCAHLNPLVSALKSEMFSRLPPAEESARWRRTRFSYYTHHPAGNDYALLIREIRSIATDLKQISPVNGRSVDENRTSGVSGEVLLDFGSLADDSGYLELGLTIVSPDEDTLAYSVDTTGDEVYELRFRDLRTGRDLDDVVPRTYYGGAWSADSQWFLYTVHDALYRPHEVWRHRIGTPSSEDVRVLVEPDERFDLSLRASRSEDVVLILSESRDTGETWVVDAHAPESTPRSVGGRRSGVLYRAEHVRGADDGDPGHLLLVTNDDAVEFRLMRCPLPTGDDLDHRVWEEARPEDPAERLEQADAFSGHLVLSVRREGEHRLRVLAHDDLAADGWVLRSQFPGGALHLARNKEYDVGAATVLDRSHVQPPVWSEVDLGSSASTELLRREVPGHDPDAYVTDRMDFPAPDGTAVSATVIRHRDTPLDGTAPALIYGYGAYEYSFEPEWEPELVSVLDRGVVYVHAHVRGGGEGGRRWWLDGRMEHKQNTFTDFIAVADGLADSLVDGTRIAGRGLSAGGLLQGAVFSQRPDRWRAIVAEVPAVDIVTTMLDPSIPLTINEWDEWGDPRRRADFDWMLAYSPYDNLPPSGTRPDLLVTGAVHDPRVMVHEPAKWVAALRASDPDWSPRCLFRCELGAGAHVGPSGRFGHLAYEAEVYAWVLDRLGVGR